MPLRLGDVRRPALVGVDRVDADADDLGVAIVELLLAAGELTELGRAYRREVCRVGEEDPPAVAEVLVESELTFRGGGGEVGCDVAELARR